MNQFERVKPGGQFSAANVNAQTDALELLTDGGGRPGYYGPNGERAEMPTTGGTGSTSPVTRLKITVIADDYITCNTWDGTTAGTDPIIVAKPPTLRSAVTAYAAPGETFNCTYDATAATRTATGATTGIVETHKLNVPYAVGDEIFAAVSVGDTGVEITGTPVTYVDLNVDGRHWVRQQT